MTAIPNNFHGAAKPLTQADIVAEAATLKCDIAIIHAFSDIESAGSGFLKDGRPQVLFEAKAFHDHTGGKYDHIAPNISSAVWNRSLYGAAGAHQWDRFNVAAKLDYEAALLSMSVGRFQAMGFNFKICGFDTVEDMYASYCDDEKEHLAGFGAFIVNTGLLPALKSNPPNFVRLAVGYNGAGERQNGYDQKLEVAFHHYQSAGEDQIPPPSGISSNATEPNAAQPTPQPTISQRVLFIGESGKDVSIAQAKLLAAGYRSTPQTGRFDAATKSYVEKFQEAHNLQVDGVIGVDTSKALGI